MKFFDGEGCLPIVIKFTFPYEEMDSQPVQGENITSSKKEIEETIDTLNVAFEKLLDSIFEDTAMGGHRVWLCLPHGYIS